MLQPPGLWDLLLWQLAQLCVCCLWFLCCGKGRCQQHMNSMDCNKVAVKPIWLVVSLPLETLGIRFYFQENSYPNGCERKLSKFSKFISLWNSSALGLVLTVCLGQTGDLVKAWGAD